MAYHYGQDEAAAQPTKKETVKAKLKQTYSNGANLTLLTVGLVALAGHLSKKRGGFY
jgi:hypothetical protein